MPKGDLKMSIMEEIRKQDLYNDKTLGYIDIDSDFAINKMSEALCEFVFGYILRLNKDLNNTCRKVYGYILLHYHSDKKIKIEEFNDSLYINNYSANPNEKNHFNNNPPFTCFISKSINENFTDNVCSNPLYICEENLSVNSSAYDKVICADCSDGGGYDSPKLGIMYYENQNVYLYPHLVKTEVHTTVVPSTRSLETNYVLSFNGEKIIVNMLAENLRKSFLEEGFIKSSFLVKDAKDAVGIYVKQYKYGLFGKKKYTGSKYYSANASPESKVIYFEVEW